METAWPHLFISTDCHARINIAPSSLFRQAGHWDRKPERATFHVDHVAGIDQWDGRPHSAFGQTLVVRTDPQTRLYRYPVRAYPAMEPTAQPNRHVCATCGPATGSPTAKPKLGASYLKFGLGQGYLRDIRQRRQCCGRPVLRAEESVESVSLHGVCMPRVTHPIGVGSPRSEPCFGGAFWSAAKRACLDLGAVSLPCKSVSTNGSNRPNSKTWHRLAVWTVGALVAGIRSKTKV